MLNKLKATAVNSFGINQMPGRNEPCVCGSGKKFKKCCLEKTNQSPVSTNSHQEHLEIAHQHMLRGELKDAENAFRRLLNDKKNHIAGLVGLGQCLCQQWRNKEGIALLLKAAKKVESQAKKTKDIRQFLDLAYLLVNLDEPQKALLLISCALSIVPDFPRAYHTKALALQKIDSKKAYLSAKKTVELAPNESNAIILLASLEAKQGHLHIAKQRLLNLIDSELKFEQDRVYKELGVILDKLGDYDAAFLSFRTAGEFSRQKKAVKEISEQAIFRELENNLKIFDGHFFEACVGKVKDNLPAPVFLIGFYRSGTTLMEQIFDSHPDITTSDEAYIIPKVAKEIERICLSKATSLSERVKCLSADEIAYLRQFYWKTAKQMVNQDLSNKLFVDKTTMNTINLGLINALFPDAIILFAVRDPRDVCLSCYMQSFSLSPLTVHFLDWQGGAKFYAAVMEYWIEVRQHLSLSCVEISYEGILNDFEGTFTPVFEQLGLSWSDECRQFYKYAQQKTIKTPSFDQVTQPLYQSSVQRWRNYEKYFEEVVEYLAPSIQYFGYE